jgi:phosphoglycerate-specific signal transduction histidine kinase
MRALEQQMQAQGARLDAKINNLAERIDRKFDDLRIELSKQFRWTVGLIVTTMGLMLTLIGLVAGR